MRHSKNYNFRLPERVDGRNDPADIDDLTYDLESADGILKAQDDEDKRLDRDKLEKSAHNQHKTAAVLDHPDDSVTDAKIGSRTVLTTSGPLQTLLTAIGTAIKAIAGTAAWNGTPPTTLTAAKEHINSKQNPHTVTKAQVGLGNADDTSDADKPVSTTQAAAIQAVQDDITEHMGNNGNPHGTTAAQTGAYTKAETDTKVAAAIADKADTADVLTKDNTAEYTPTESYHPATKKYIDDQMGAAGSGDMMKAVYDQDGDGIVDNAEKVNGFTVGCNVPAGAKFTDTVYTHPNDTSTRHVTDTEKTSWNGKEPAFTKNNAFNKAFGTAAGTVCQGNDSRLSNARAPTSHSHTTTYTATIGTAWSGSGPWTQNIAVAGVVAADNPVVDLVLSGTDATDRQRMDAWGMVSRITTYAGGITVRCLDDKPTAAIPIQIKAVR